MVDRPAPRSGGASSSAALIGANLGPYRVVELLGAGGMGEVFRAERSAPFRMTVAIKVLRAGLLNETARHRFVREQQALADLHHPAIVRILDAGETDDGRPYFVMQYIDGSSLAETVCDNPLPSYDAAALILDIAEAVAFVHKKGFLHRDLKPHNVLVDADGRAHVADFGVARMSQSDLSLTRTGDLIGTPSYMSPEQAEGRRQDIGPASDIYGLGAILYFLLTGHPPFLGSNARDTIHQVATSRLMAVQAARPGLDPKLEELCLRCLEKEPSKRPESVREVVNTLRTILGRPRAPSSGTSSLDLPALTDRPASTPPHADDRGTRLNASRITEATKLEPPQKAPPSADEGESTSDRPARLHHWLARHPRTLAALTMAMACVLVTIAWFSIAGALALAAGLALVVALGYLTGKI